MTKYFNKCSEISKCDRKLASGSGRWRWPTVILNSEMIGEKQLAAHTDIVVMTTGADNLVSGGAQSFNFIMESSVVNEKKKQQL